MSGGFVKQNKFLIVAVFSAILPLAVPAQSPADIAALRGLAPVSVLANNAAGKEALKANLTVTGGIQTGVIPQPTLLPFPEQQQQALRDAFITGKNLAQLSDGLGATLGAAYVARAHYIDRKNFTSISQHIADLIAFADGTSGSSSNAGKFFFANRTTNGAEPVSAEALAIYKENGGAPDPFGRAYGKPAGSAGAGKYGDARPFQTESRVAAITGRDYFNQLATNADYNHGIWTDLTNSPSFPSGHTTYGYTGSLLLALLVPERYSQMITRGAEYGNDRILMGAHYAMDVLGGRTVALYDMAHLLANDPMYVGHTARGTTITDFREALKTARAELTAVLQENCGKTVAACAREDLGRFNDSAANEAFYLSTQTYNLPVVYAETAAKTEDVKKVAPEAGYLLTVAFPALTLDQGDDILTQTEGPGGGFLDNGSAFGLYSRLNLYAAARRAEQIRVRAER